MTFNLRKKGFTLIELLVVISIIALLTSVVLGQLNNARAKARDRALYEGVRQVQNALELYKAKYGYYPKAEINPNTPSYWYTKSSAGAENSLNGGTHLSEKLKDFIKEIPKPTSGNFTYYNFNIWCSNQASNSGYMIAFKPEIASPFSSFPDVVNSAGLVATYTGYKCVSLK